MNFVVSTICDLSKQEISQLVHQKFGHVSICRLKRMARKGIMDGLPTNIPDLEDTFPIFLLTKATEIPRSSTIEVSKFPPGFMFKMIFFVFQC